MRANRRSHRAGGGIRSGTRSATPVGYERLDSGGPSGDGSTDDGSGDGTTDSPDPGLDSGDGGGSDPINDDTTDQPKTIAGVPAPVALLMIAALGATGVYVYAN